MSIAEPNAARPISHPSREAGNSSHRSPFWIAAALSVGLIPIFLLQVFWAKALITPWYLPIGGSLAALLVLYALGKRRTWPRLVVALVCVALACLEWYFLLALTVLPSYAGPMVAGSQIPPFHAALADGTPIGESYFAQGRPTALVFFQGRWCPFCMTQLKELEAHHEDFARIGANVVVVSIEDVDSAAQTQEDFPHLTVASDERRELSEAIDLINKGSAPDGGDSAAPTILLIDRQGTIRSLYRPARFIARPSAAELVTAIETGNR